MTINSPAFYSSSAEFDPQTVIELLGARPVPRQVLTTPVEANRLAGFYDPAKGFVELFVSSPDGTFWMRVSG